MWQLAHFLSSFAVGSQWFIPFVLFNLSLSAYFSNNSHLFIRLSSAHTQTHQFNTSISQFQHLCAAEYAGQTDSHSLTVSKDEYEMILNKDIHQTHKKKKKKRRISQMLLWSGLDASVCITNSSRSDTLVVICSSKLFLFTELVWKWMERRKQCALHGTLW